MSIQAIFLGAAKAIHYKNLGGTLPSLKQHEEAPTAFRQALAINPGHADAHPNLALARHETGNPTSPFARFTSRCVWLAKRSGRRSPGAHAG